MAWCKLILLADSTSAPWSDFQSQQASQTVLLLPKNANSTSVSMEEARCGAVCPGDASPVLMIRVDCSLFSCKKQALGISDTTSHPQVPLDIAFSSQSPLHAESST